MGSVTGSIRGWSYYFRHKVRNAGLGFDNITWAYSLLQCVPEYILGLLVAVSSVFGIAGSLAFPVLRKCLGNTERAGVLGMFCLVASLSLCVVSGCLDLLLILKMCLRIVSTPPVMQMLLMPLRPS